MQSYMVKAVSLPLETGSLPVWWHSVKAVCCDVGLEQCSVKTVSMMCY